MLFRMQSVWFVCLLAMVALPALAEQSKDTGDYVIHYNAFPSDILAPQVARQYGIVRSKDRAVLNITVMKKAMGVPNQPVPAWVKARATNLTNQLRSIPMREVRERNAIYYLSQFRVADQETLKFHVMVQPVGQKQAFKVEFSQKFSTR